MHMTARFCQLPVGARFEFRGQRYQKQALSLAENEVVPGGQKIGNVFMAGAEVVPDPGVELLASSWKREDDNWWVHLSPAPGPVTKGPPGAPGSPRR